MRTAILTALFACLSLPATLRAEEPIDSITRNDASFPEDIRIYDDPEDSAKVIIEDPVVTTHHQKQIHVDKTEQDDAKKTLELAKKSGAMVFLEDSIKISVQIPVLKINPDNLIFKPIDKPGIQFWFIKGSWLEVRTKDKGVLIGTTCRGCSKGEMDEHISKYQDLLQEAVTAGEKQIEVDLTKDSEKILVREMKVEYYDPRQIVFKPIFFKGVDTPTGIQVYQVMNKELDQTTETVATVANDYVQSLENRKAIFFLPVRRSTERYEFSTLTIGSPEVEEVKVKGIAVIDGFPYFKILGERSIVFQYHKVLYTYARVLEKAIRENRKIAVHRTRVRAQQLVITGSDVPIDE